MKVHLNQIPEDGLHLEGEEEGDILEIDDPFIRATSAVRYSLDLGISENGLFATGTLEIDLEMQCVRCLRDFRQTFRLDSFAMQVDLEGPEIIDLTPLLREDILLALPAHPHCDGDGSTVCPGAKPVEILPETEPASSAPKAWEALDQLQIRSRSK